MLRRARASSGQGGDDHQRRPRSVSPGRSEKHGGPVRSHSTGAKARSSLTSWRRRTVARTDPALSLQLVLAVSQGDLVTAARLVQEPEVDVNMSDYEGRTALHHAARAGDLECVRLLMARGARSNIPDRLGRSAILEARSRQADDVVAFLRSHGAVDSSKWIERRSAAHKNRSRHDTPMSPSEESNTAASPPRDESADTAKESTGQQMAPGVLQRMALLMAVPFVVLLLLQGSWFILCFILSSFVYFFLVGAYLVSEVSIRPPWYEPTPQTGELTKNGLPAYWQGIYTNPRYDLDLDYEDVEFQNERRMTLRGWWVPAQLGDPPPEVAVVMVHGGGRDRRAWLRHVQMFHEEGFPCLLFDFREHGISDGACRGFSYGAREKYDVLAAVDWAREAKRARKVVVIGTSVGGCAVILATARDAKLSSREPGRQRAIDLCIAENPPSHATELQSYHMRSALAHYAGGRWHAQLLLRAFDELAQLVLRIRIGIFPRGAQALDVVGLLGVPLLLMHGTGDDVVPHQHSELLFREACEPKELWMAPDAFHCGLYDRYPQEFRQRVFSFIRTHLPNAPGSKHIAAPPPPPPLPYGGASPGSPAVQSG
eukprot:TRINITY_DN2937_c3_g1_i1.p1 TRINITY_DN2937_c3_g1~~TRINITY_DN2937_c3_g1_i1.p1  ORF type:complete len:599 (+),score=137.06 TRINITY_DN2937_c3_g1_i1:61-1857(+)